MSKMADDDLWLLKEDGYLNVDAECKSIIYHANLNLLLITTGSAQVYVFDVSTGVILQKSSLSGKLNEKLQGVYLGDGIDKVLYTDGRAIGVRSDYNGVLLLNTILQTPVSRSEDIIKIELLLSEASLLVQCLRCVELPGVDHVQEVVLELSSKIFAAEVNQKKGIKAQKWNTVCLELPHGSLKLVCSGLVMELKRQSRHIPALPIASAINERLNGLLPAPTLAGGPADRALMFSEAARRDTFTKWPHMNYKWALPDQMAQAGFYHEPNDSGEDRAMCFTCNVCLVFWEPTDEPWSEHERHSPACPFVKGEYTQNVALPVTLSTAPARESGDSVDVIGTTNVSSLIATSSSSGSVKVWNVTNQLKRQVSFHVVLLDQDINNKETIQFGSSRNLTLSNRVQVTALSIVGSFKPSNEDSKTVGSKSVSTNIEVSDSKIRPCIVCAVTVTINTPLQLRTLDNVWATSTDLNPSSPLVRAMNTVNSAASDTLDIMKVAGDRYTPSKLHYLVLYDFHHKTAIPQPIKKDNTKDSKTKKTLSGTGTSASANGGRQESMFQEFLLGKFMCEIPVIEDVDSDMVVGQSFDGIFPTTALTASSSNGIYSNPMGVMVPQTASPFDANFNPINGPEHFASTSDLTVNKKGLDIMKLSKTEPVVIQTLPIEAPDCLKITYLAPSKDGRHLYVAMCPTTYNTFTDPSTLNSNQMDIDEETEFFPQKGYMYWDHNVTQSDKLINGEVHGNSNNTNAVLLVYALDFSGQVVKIAPEPVVKRDLPAEQAPVEHVFLPLRERNNCTLSSGNSTTNSSANSVATEPSGQVALVCRDGVVRVLNLSTLKTVTEAIIDGKKFVSASYCNSLERLCACTSDGALHFFVTTDDEDSGEEKEYVEDVNMGTAEECRDKNTVPSASTSTSFQEQIIAHKPSLSYLDLRTLYELTRFDRHSPAYGANVPPCWGEIMQAQRQRRQYQHHTRTWRLQNDATSWDEHVFELTLPRSSSENIGHVDVRFSLHSFCQELPKIQITLLKQNIRRIGCHKPPLTPVDEKIDFSMGNEQKEENPVITDEYQRQHNTEILCGPIDLHRCMDLSCRSGCVTLTSPKLFRSKARTLLVHIKALVDPAKDGATSKSKINVLENKPPNSKKLRIVEVRPLVPGSTVERFVEGASSKKLDRYIGCDWIHEISITVRSVYPTNISNERAQRCAMLESKSFFDNLLNVACLQTTDKSPIVQSLALDILIWVTSIRLTRLRSSQSSADIKTLQVGTINSVQAALPNLLKTCILHTGRSISHKCVKLILLCSGGFYTLEEPPPNPFDESVLSVLVTLLPSIVEVQWAGSLRWLQLLITRFLPLDRNHSVAQQCVSLVQQIAAEISNRANPYHLLLATRFGLYNSPFETELFDLEPPMPPKYTPIPVTYVSVASNEQAGPPATSSSSVYSQDAIDLRDLLTLPTHPGSELVVPSKLKALCSNHNMKGLLEVEALHFTCHAASDGTKMEKIDPEINTINIGAPLYHGTATNNGVPDIKTIHHTSVGSQKKLDAGSLGPDVQAKSTCTLSDRLTLLYTGQVLKKLAPQLILTPDDQSDCDETNDLPVENQAWHNTQNDMPNSHTLSSTVTKEKSSVQNSNTTVNKVEDSNPKKREDVTFPWGRLLCWPPQQVLVVDRMHSGARRFVILDFGSPILLTDMMIPSCSDLATLTIDIWTKSEEIDGTRLMVASDIGSKPLVVCDLQPPPVCRYLKITTIGRYEMTTTMCKIPLGVFYGHILVLPGEDYSELNNSHSISDDIFDSSVQATIDTQCNILSALAEDVQCRFSLATERLKSLLDPLLCSETSNVMHMQHYLNCNKLSSENKQQPSSKILLTYQECIMFQHQLNVVRSVWRRLESWRGSENTPTTSLANAPTDKLRVLGETLLDILLYTVYEIGPVPSIPMSICDVFTPSICEKFFHSICVVTPAPRLQLHAAAFLARMAGHQPWWGTFLSNTLINFYSSSSTHIFPQDRVFILLTFLGRKSLIGGVNKSSVIDAMVRTLGRLLMPLTNGQTSDSSHLDITLIGWVLLFLSVCLDTTAIPPPSVEGNHERNREPGLLSRWEFIQGESAMQKKYGNTNRSPASDTYRKRLQKRLMYHKQQLLELEQAKKAFHAASQGWASLPTKAATLCDKVEATVKSQERSVKKSLKEHYAKEHYSKHPKDNLSIRRNDGQHVSRSPRTQPQPNTSSSKSEAMDTEIEHMPTLAHQHVLPVARGLIALILYNSANVDMFLLASKVVARLVVSTRPAISLCELMSEEQLLRLVRLATGTSDAAWSSHAVSCLLQDLLEGGKLYPKPCTTHEASPPEESFETPVTEESQATEEEPASVAGTSTAAVNSLSAQVTAEEGEEFTQDCIVITPATLAMSKSNGWPSLFESDDSDLEDFLDDILERGRSMLKKGYTVSKILTSTSSGISLAMDARLEYGVEMGVEILLRMLSTLGMYNLPHSINATIHVPTQSNRYCQQTSRIESGWNDRSQDVWNSSDPTSSSLSMLTRCFDKIFTDLYLQSAATNLELVLQLWLTLNLDASGEQSGTFNELDSSLAPVIPLSSAAISSLISALSWHPGVSLRAWCLALQCLTLASNQPLQTDTPELDGILGGMAGCIVKERNMGPMLLRLLSGTGLNINAVDKQYIMAGPTVCQALQDFLLKFKVRCDIITPGSSSGNALKELLLWVVYQLVQPGGALSARRGPLDAQCKLITSLTNVNFANTDLGTAMSISECVGVLVSTYVIGSGIGAQCGGTADLVSKSGGFGGLFACVLGGDTRQGRPASWDNLVVALIKLVCRLIQTPLPNARPNRSDSTAEDLPDFSLGSTSGMDDSQVKINMSQTDESKVAEQQTFRLQQAAPKPRVPCVADTVLQHEPTMMRLLGALGHSTGSSLAMLLGETAGAGTATELGDPASIPDATFQLLTTLTKKASNPTLVLNPLYQYLSSACGQRELDRQLGVMQLSEPLLWYILRVLDNETSLSIFNSMGGVKVLCENLVKSSTGNGGSNSASPGVIALVMEHLSNAPNAAPAATTSSKKPVNSLESQEDGLLNFAPLGTISWLHPTAQSADVLIQNATPHRRARTAAWLYHCYPDEAWVDLTIILPYAILLRKVELHPHLTSLATCPSAVAIEVSREANCPLTPVCPPMPTAGLTFIRITLPQPAVATSVLVRLYKPRDSTNLSLSQIRLLGTTAFGEIKTSHDAIDEEQLTKTSLGWLRLLHQCLSVSTLNSSLAVEVLNSAASVEGLVEACCNLLLLPAPSLFTPNLERVLLQLGLHSQELGLRLIGILLNNRSTPFYQGTVSTQETSTVQLVVELLQQLCSIQDSCTEARLTAVLSWLQASAANGISRSTSNPNVISPPAVYIHCVSSIIWKAHQQQTLNYDLEALLTEELFIALYKWTLTLGTGSALKQAIDSAICAFCYVKPALFPLLLETVRILVPNLATDHSASISDDRKEREGQTDDKKSEINGEEWYCRFVLLEYKRLNLTEGQLLTVAAAARSPPGIQQLIDSGLPALLTASITDFCNLEKAKRQREGRRSSEDDCRNTSLENVSLTDSDKAGETSSQINNNHGGLCMTEPESIAMVLEFLTLVCSEGKMRDWLGKEGRGFWLPLLSLLSNRPIENPSVSSLRYSKTSVSYATLESVTIKFLSRCCWCHFENQKLLAELLTDVISQQRTTSNARYLHGISGFTRRLILQLLLEGEKVLVSITSEAPMKVSSSSNNYSMPSMPPHPAHPLGHYHKLLYMSTQSIVADILQQVSGTWPLLLLPNTYKGTEAGTSNNRSRELWESGIAFIADTLSVAAGNRAKDKRAKEASNRSQARGPVVRKSRLNCDATTSANKSPNNNVQPSTSSSTNQQYLTHPSRPNTPLPPQLTIAQLLAIAEDSGTSLSEPCLNLILRQRNKDFKDDLAKQNISDLLNYRSIESSLGVFSAGGGLAVLARHLPLVYPDSRRPPPVPEKSPSPEQTDAEWVKLENSDDIYEDAEDARTNSSPRASSPAPYVPPHSLAAFGLFLRLPGYAEVLLRDRKRAQCLLRLALGVSDDGEGGDVLTSPLATSLPTLPFQVLKQLLDATPPTTDDGLLLRKTTIEVGAMLLLLNCLAIFTHHAGQNDGPEQRVGGQSAAGRSDDNTHLYWAKGTGFGTGSTEQSWNVEQALLRQKSEEEHVTVLLQVLASYIGSGSHPQRELPPLFPDLLARSCLLPALSSYLRNDSVLDMARHIPLYRTVLQLLRAMALSTQLVPLLLPRSGRSSDPSVVSLLSSMRVCVDTYVHKINRTRGNKSKTLFKYPDDTEQDEGLATLIPDIQESATIVQNATFRLSGISEELPGPSPTGPELPLRSIEQRYLEVMKNLQFDTYEMITENPDAGGYKFAVSYHFESNMRAAGERSHPTRVKRLAQEAVTLCTALPLSYSSSVFVRCDTDRLDVMKVLITGPAETPYANGCFEFDVYFPSDYPNSPMLINLETTGRHTVRFNPNLYNDGKVCLSVLNTWQGRPEEKWNAHTSSFLQVLVSIQSLILVSEPYFNEPGYERSRGTPSGAQSSQQYNANICQVTAKWAMLDQIRNPCPCFKEVIHTHFWIKRHEIVAQLEGWIRDMELHSSDRIISLNALALRGHYRLLREELNKLPTPEGLDDLIQPLASPGSPIELTGSPSTSNTQNAPMSVTSTPSVTLSNAIVSIDNADANNHVHHDIDTDVEMEKMVSKVCE